MTDPSRARVTGPLAPFRAGFVAELRRQGYTPMSASYQMQLMAHLSRWLAEEGLDSHGLSAAAVERFFDARRAAGYASYLSSKSLAPLLGFLRDLQAAPPPPPPPAPAGPVEELLCRYQRYLTVERGLTAPTTKAYADMVRPFLAGRAPREGHDLGLGSADVTAFVLDRCRRQPRSTAKRSVTALRSLLGFLHLEGLIDRPLAVATPSIAGWRLAGLPKGLEPVQVRGLLAACDRDSAKGLRDFAIITTLIRLALRSGELAALELDDIDWRAGEIHVRGKGGRDERLPLPDDVGEAITAYLRCGRPTGVDGRPLFVRVLAPYRALSNGGVTDVVAAAARRAGLGRIYAHRLRHTAATETLRAGAALPEVGQLLRHHRAETTAIYAKVDREALRRLARPWPEGVA